MHAVGGLRDCLRAVAPQCLSGCGLVLQCHLQQREAQVLCSGMLGVRLVSMWGAAPILEQATWLLAHVRNTARADRY